MPTPRAVPTDPDAARPATPAALRLLPRPARTPADGPILLSPPHLTGRELAGIAETLQSGWVAPAGPATAAFEAALADATGQPHVLAVSSGTAALHLGYRCLGIAPGDAVWTASLTYVATIAPAVQMGARPHFLDVAPDSWTLDPDLLERDLSRAARRGRLPRAVVPVDLFGQSAELEVIRALCDRWGVAVMADSAEALGATQHGRPAGQGARLAAFSFNGNKIVTAGGGGALASADAGLIAMARGLANQARQPAPHYEHETTGYSYGLSSILAAIGMVQLAALQDRIAARRAIFGRYHDGLAGLPGLGFMPEPDWSRGTRWLTVIQLDPGQGAPGREAVRLALAAAGIETRPVWKPMHLQPAFRHAGRSGGAVAARLFERGLCLPSGSGLTPARQARVIDRLRACWAG
ncbi:aminotransferase class I/II-fold pyridoxal phosphate-dependent enzyme [Paeniroseomonas aquatica]|uniref:Aminotransferase class I/II-fold pyridoxal phosphate-dependent enzyme n=1 Tax=Paeniroseomonas aquatica TaxID=373043 RepID=A0ABT8A8W8_9PROT|nr:aminotransferase class I/II-fold pyridoxal phosphate-dependent enzyme [Paeniroseomonas aquatica]MDN3566081.1 aminotransferase class I/II-fold pyridoxal phosphate-dependent enzyme [Paeniroseomonas aquatica]